MQMLMIFLNLGKISIFFYAKSLSYTYKWYNAISSLSFNVSKYFPSPSLSLSLTPPPYPDLKYSYYACLCSYEISKQKREKYKTTCTNLQKSNVAMALFLSHWYYEKTTERKKMSTRKHLKINIEK